MIQVQRKMTYAVVALFILFALASAQGCSAFLKNKVDAATGLPLTAEQVASVIADELFNESDFWQGQVEDVLNTGTPAQKAYLHEHVTKELDQAKRLVQAYNDTVIAWRTKGEVPGDLVSREAAIRAVIHNIAIAFTGR